LKSLRSLKENVLLIPFVSFIPLLVESSTFPEPFLSVSLAVWAIIRWMAFPFTGDIYFPTQ
jgi:hypothetical protein